MLSLGFAVVPEGSLLQSRKTAPSSRGTLDQKLLVDALPWFRTLALPFPTVNAECVMNNLLQFNFGEHLLCFWLVFNAVFGFFQAQALRPGRSRQHLDQSRLHFPRLPLFQWDHEDG